VRTPQLFLMDEPLSNLDARLRTVMRAELKHLQRDLATTTIYVTHDQVEAMTLADRIAVLNAAEIQQVGTPAEIYARPANLFVAGFIGAPPMNLIEGACDGAAFRTGAGLLPLAAPPGPAVLGVRPEDIALVAPEGAPLAGTVYSSELLGDSAVVTVALGRQLVAAKVGPAGGLPIGTPVGLCPDPTKLHIFDAATGLRRADPDLGRVA
jgi:multiple sugar transport system ATP-binding protein